MCLSRAYWASRGEAPHENNVIRPKRTKTSYRGNQRTWIYGGQKKKRLEEKEWAEKEEWLTKIKKGQNPTDRRVQKKGGAEQEKEKTDLEEERRGEEMLSRQ